MLGIIKYKRPDINGGSSYVYALKLKAVIETGGQLFRVRNELFPQIPAKYVSLIGN